MRETHKRTLVKILFFRSATLITSFAITYIFFGSLTGAIALSIVTNITMTILHYVNERIWNRISWGLIKNEQ